MPPAHLARLLVLLLASGARGLAVGSGRHWHRAKEAAHSGVIELVRASLLSTDGRSLPAGCVHVEPTVSDLPADYGLPRVGPLAQLTPDIVAVDRSAQELLLIEVTIVPGAALGRYVYRKRLKYQRLCRAVTADEAADLHALPPLVVALGTDGAVPATTAEACARIGMDGAATERFLSSAVALARARPDAPRRGRGEGSAEGRLSRRATARRRHRTFRRATTPVDYAQPQE